MINKNLSRYFFIAVLLGTTLVFFRMVQVFLVPVLLAAVFATLFYPMYEFFVRRFRGRRSLAAFTCCFILLLGLVAPLYAVADMVTREAIDVYQSAEVWIGDLLRKGGEGPLARLNNLP
ncbi:MAG: AI-2E family transporter, partial [Thermoanaerobaculia bacterium]